MQTASTANDEVMALVMEEARRIASELVERRVRGIQRVVARKDEQIAELRRQLAHQEESTTDD